MLKTPDNLTQIPRSTAGSARNMAAPAFFIGLLSGWGLAIVALAACWLLFFIELRGEWATNAQYNYGYVVPLLGAALLWRRWQERPASLPGNATSAWLMVARVMPKPARTSANTLCLLAACASNLTPLPMNEA